MASNFNRRGFFRRLTEVSTESMNEGFCSNQSQQLFMVFHKNLTAVLSIIVDREPRARSGSLGNAAVRAAAEQR